MTTNVHRPAFSLLPPAVASTLSKRENRDQSVFLLLYIPQD